LSGDIEMNPGPVDQKYILMTQNCRGLNEPNKLRALIKNMRQKAKNEQFVLALQETYLINDNDLKWHNSNSSLNYAFTKAESTHSTGCITFLKETTRILEKKDIDEVGHGHVVVVEGMSEKLTIIGNIYSPVRSLPAEQESFYENLSKVLEELELKYLDYEPDLIILGDFNLPFEPNMNTNNSERIRAQSTLRYLESLGLRDCWDTNDNRITCKSGRSRLDRVMYRLNGNFRSELITDWTFTSSDHCLVQLNLTGEKSIKSRRVTSLPTYILNSTEDVEYIKNGINEFKLMCDDRWEAAKKLEFLKMGLRTVVGECIKRCNIRERERNYIKFR
jgi:hypothetical protein